MPCQSLQPIIPAKAISLMLQSSLSFSFNSDKMEEMVLN